MKTIAILILFASVAFAHPPQAQYTAPPPPAVRLTMPEKQGRQTIIDQPIVNDTFIQERIRERVTYLPTIREVEYADVAARLMYAEQMPMRAPAVGYYAAPAVYYAPRAPVYYEPSGAYTEARYDIFGRLRSFKTTGDPRDIHRSAPGPVATFFGAR